MILLYTPCSRKKCNITAFFAEYVKFLKKEDFYSTLGEQWQIKVKKLVKRLDTLKLLYKCKCNIQSQSSHPEVPLKIGVPKK